MKSGTYDRSGRSPCAMHRSPKDESDEGPGTAGPEHLFPDGQPSDHSGHCRDEK